MKKIKDCSQSIQNFFVDVYDIKNQDFEVLFSEFEYIEYHKHNTIQKKNEESSYLYFLCEGIVRVFTIQNDLECSIGFFSDQGLFSSPDCIMTTAVTAYEIQAVSDCVVLRIKKQRLQALANANSRFQALSFKMFQQLHNDLLKDNEMLKTNDAKSRYTQFLKSRKILNKIPVNMISTYLGIHANSLSRIRLQLKKSKTITYE